MKDELHAPPYEGGERLATKWITHPVTGMTTVTVLNDRPYLLVEPEEDSDARTDRARLARLARWLHRTAGRG